MCDCSLLRTTSEIREKTDKSDLRIHQPVLVNMPKKTSSVEERAFVAWHGYGRIF